MSKKFITTTLEKGQFMPMTTKAPFDLHPYRNSNSPKEGLTISRSELLKNGVPPEALMVGTRFKMAILVKGVDQMPVLQFHMNARGAYVTGPVVDYHESMNFLPVPRIPMGGKKRGIDYSIKVGHIEWSLEEPVQDQDED